VPLGPQELLSEAPALIADVLSRFGEARLRVIGGSMFPLVRSGDILTVRCCSSDQLQPGDIVLVRDGQRLFAHRLLAVQSSAGRTSDHSSDDCWLITRGDSHWHCDPLRPASALVGRVVSLTRSSRVLDEPFALSVWDRLRGLSSSAWIDIRRSLTSSD
jgi:hypothetical protein